MERETELVQKVRVAEEMQGKLQVKLDHKTDMIDLMDSQIKQYESGTNLLAKQELSFKAKYDKQYSELQLLKSQIKTKDF